MNNQQWQAKIQETAQALAYPPTPDVTNGVAQRLSAPRKPQRVYPLRMAWVSIAMLLILLVGLWSVPQVRAAVREWLQIGAVRIWLVEPTATPPPATVTPASISIMPTAITPTVTPIPTATPLASILDLSGEQTLAEAQTQLDFPLRLPTYPPDLGAPDHIFVQHTNGSFVVLVWTHDDEATQIQQILYQIGPGVHISKGGPLVLRATTVHGQPAAWITGMHYLLNHTGNFSQMRGIGQDVLLWTEVIAGQEITYRLETNRAEDEAVRIAESLRKATSIARQNCPVTAPPTVRFVPPAPYLPYPPSPNYFWYGTDALWVAIPKDGRWYALPHDAAGYTQKIFWWRTGYSWLDEPKPKLTVTGRHLDAAAPPFSAGRATSAYAADIQSAMLVGVKIPTHGCWEISGQYEDTTLRFVIWVAP